MSSGTVALDTSIISRYSEFVKGYRPVDFHDKVEEDDAMMVATRRRRTTIRETMKGYLTLSEMAEKYGLVDGSALRHAIRSQRLHAELSGKTYFVTEADAAAYKAEHLRKRGPKRARALPGKYEKLLAWLAETTGDAATLTYAEVETMIDTALPASAMTTKDWWRNRAHRHVAQWHAMGWEANPDRDQGRICWTRDNA